MAVQSQECHRGRLSIDTKFAVYGVYLFTSTPPARMGKIYFCSLAVQKFLVQSSPSQDDANLKWPTDGQSTSRHSWRIGALSLKDFLKPRRSRGSGTPVQLPVNDSRHTFHHLPPLLQAAASFLQVVFKVEETRGERTETGDTAAKQSLQTTTNKRKCNKISQRTPTKLRFVHEQLIPSI